MLRQSVFCISLLLSTCAVQPAFANVFPETWDGSCIVILPINENHHRNPNVWKGQGYIPADKQPDDSDISTCLPPPANGMGPK